MSSEPSQNPSSNLVEIVEALLALGALRRDIFKESDDLVVAEIRERTLALGVLRCNVPQERDNLVVEICE
jgi:hypothetical protein